MEQNEVSQVKATEVANVDEELQALLEKGKALQARENSDDYVKASYILLAKPSSKALIRANKDLYVEGLQIGEFYLQKERKNLGRTLKVVPLMFVTIYNETDGGGTDARYFGMWNKEQAIQYPLVEGSYFDRQLPNGHILTPTHWVMVEIIGHPEIENAVIAYKRTGSRIWKQWKEDAKLRSGSSATLVYEVFEDTYQNDKFSWTDTNFKLAGNLLESDKNMAITCLKKSNALRESYENKVFIQNHDTASAVASNANAKAIADTSVTEDAGDEEEELGF
jgi:hypothetical protein